MATTGTPQNKRAATTQQGPPPKPRPNEAETDLIQWLEKCRGRKLTQREINLAIDQARAIGDL
jgi:hypothetical protein